MARDKIGRNNPHDDAARLRTIARPRLVGSVTVPTIPALDARYLRLDATNDPLTGPLDILATDAAALRVLTAANAEVFKVNTSTSAATVAGDIIHADPASGFRLTRSVFADGNGVLREWTTAEGGTTDQRATISLIPKGVGLFGAGTSIELFVDSTSQRFFEMRSGTGGNILISRATAPAVALPIEFAIGQGESPATIMTLRETTGLSVKGGVYTPIRADGTAHGQFIIAANGDDQWSIYSDNDTVLRFYKVPGTPGDVMTLTSAGALATIGTVQGTQLISTIPTGTKPIDVQSTTLNTNLNADLLDGNHAAAFALAGASASPIGTALTRGSLYRGSALNVVEALALGGISGSVLSRDATDPGWTAWGLVGTAAQVYTFGTSGGTIPTSAGTLTVSTTNAISAAGVITHAITTSSDVSAGASAILASNAGALTLQLLKLYGSASAEFRFYAPGASAGQRASRFIQSTEGSWAVQFCPDDYSAGYSGFYMQRVVGGSDVGFSNFFRLLSFDSGGLFTKAKFNSLGVAWSADNTLKAIVFNGAAAERPEISWIRGGRNYPEFSIRQNTTSDKGGEFYSGAGTGSPTLTMTMVLGKVGIATTQLIAGVTYSALNVNGSALFVGASSVQEREMASFVPSYVVNTDASFTTRLIANVYDRVSGTTYAREALRIESNGAAMFGVLGHAASAQQAGAAAIAGATYTTMEQAMIQAAYDCLRAFGFMA